MAANRIWIDIETNGLDPRVDAHIFEVGVIATTADADYRELASQSWVVGWDVDDAWLRARMSPEVYSMHMRSNLLHEIPFGESIAVVEEQLCKFIDFFGNPAPGREPLCGSSPHFDREWLCIHMPRVMKRFSHRLLCASGVRAFMNDCGVQLPKPADAAHRVLPDLRHSIQTVRDAAKAVR